VEGTIARIVIAAAEEPVGLERCPRCGRRLVFTIDFDNAG
jgi:hypothetical protein